ncbi:MAG: hypothetical protein K2G93_01005 [Rikenella sp.]|nr:hypothetical protein [Rikenella sp.]
MKVVRCGVYERLEIMRWQYPILLFFVLVLSVTAGYGQVKQITTFVFDSAAPRLLSGLVGMQMTVSNDQDNKQTDITLLASAKFRYINQRTEYSFYARQFWEQKDDGGFGRKTTLLFNPTIGKYRVDPTTGELQAHTVQFMPLLFFNANSDRGLRGALQIGGMVSPWHYQNKWFGFSFGLGPVASFENWDMYNTADIAKLSPAKQEQIAFVNERLRLHKGQYYRFFDLKAMLYVDLQLKVLKRLQINIGSYIQEGLLNPYPRAVTERYPRMRHHYPHWVAEVDASVTLLRNLAITVSCRMDYEKSLVVLYKSNFEYYSMIGVNWLFNKSFSRPVGHRAL